MSGLECTHVVAWVPGYLTEPPSAEGWWEMLTIDQFDSGNMPDNNPWTMNWPRDTGTTGNGLLSLHRWVAERLGWRVTLEERTQTIWRRRWSRGHREPVYYVWQVPA